MPNYRDPVKFSVTNQFGCGPSGEDDVYTVEEFKSRVKMGAFVDSDGYGHPVKNNLCDCDIDVYPSEINMIPVDATHVVWYNK